MNTTSTIHFLSPKVIWNIFGMNHKSIHFLQSMTLSLNNATFLGVIGAKKIMSYFFRSTKIREVWVLEFSSVITMNTNNLDNFFSFLTLQILGNTLKDCEGIIILSNELNPCVSRVIINTKEKAYFLLPRVSTCTGPMRSVWRSSSTRVVLGCFTFLCYILDRFPIWQSS